MNPNLILLIHCPDREGLVASVTTLIRRVHGNIVDLDQHVDAERGVFFMRVEWTPPAATRRHAIISIEAFAEEVAAPYAMPGGSSRPIRRMRIAVFVSKYSHCLYDLLSRWQSGEWAVDIPVIVSNHADLAHVAGRYGVRFEHMPVTRDDEGRGRARQLALLREESIDLVVLARYMQILSPDSSRRCPSGSSTSTTRSCRRSRARSRTTRRSRGA